MTKILGLDVGGAHLKAAALHDGRLTNTRQVVCPLWQGADKLDAALLAIADLIADADVIAATMTAELSDLFENRQSGVRWIVDRLAIEFPAHNIRYWSADGIFLSADKAKQDPDAIASMNYLATAHFAARHTANSILIDMGTTTTDIIPVLDGKPEPLGKTDAERLANSELVYTGLTRTAVMAVTDEIPFQGQRVPICREVFATMADVQRVLGTLPEGIDEQATADGRGRSIEESTARLARMLGRDAADAAQQDWGVAARYLARRQMQPISHAVAIILSRHPKLYDAPVVATGCAHEHLFAFAANEGFDPV
ncbi:MAG: hydantoinase/oxoprolinase family protein, partial [Pseudomonadota bacterium]